MGVSQLRIPLSEPLIESAILLCLVSVDLEYQDGWCSSIWESDNDSADDDRLENVTDLLIKMSNRPPWP